MARIAWLAFLVVCVLVFIRNKENVIIRRLYEQMFSKAALVVIIPVVLTALAGLFFLKTGSVKGRMLIYHTTMSMIKDNMLFGIGWNQFPIQYNNYQAKYISTHGTSSLTMYADNVYVAFNDYLQTGAEVGITGTVLILLTFYVMIRYSGQQLLNLFNPSGNNRIPFIAFASLAAFMICGIASYPFQCNYLTLYMLLCFAVMVQETPLSKKYVVTIHRKSPGIFIRCLGILAATYMLCLSCHDFTLRLRHRKAVHLANADQWEQAKEIYQELYPQMKHEATFLFNYGAELSQHDEFAKSNEVLTEAQRYYTHSSLYLYLGSNYELLDNFKAAEASYLHAIYMVPSKLLNKYMLFNLYKTAGKKAKAMEWARIILKTPVKVSNPLANSYRSEAAQYIKEIKTRHPSF